MQEINTLLVALTNALGTMGGLPCYVLNFLFCFALEFFLKTWKRFPSDGTWLPVIAFSAAFQMFTADPLADSFPLRIWIGKNFVFGALIGVAATLAYHFRRKIPLIGKYFQPDPQ